MPTGRFNQRQSERGEKSRSRQRQPDLFDILYGTFGDPELRQQSTVEKNGALLRQSLLLEPSTSQLGLSASQVEMGDGRSTIHIKESDPLVRANEQVGSKEAPLVDELSNEGLSVTKKDGSVAINGRILVDYATALMVGDNAVAFRRPEFDFAVGRGFAGPVGLAHDHPGHQIPEEINQEHFMVGKKGKEEVIVGVDTGQPLEQQKQMLRQTRERVLQGYRSILAQKLKRGGEPKELEEINRKVANLSRPREIVLLPKKALSPEADSHMQTIETKIQNGHERSEKIRGYLNFDAKRRIATVGQIVRIDPAEAGVEIKEIIDGLGMNREIRYTAPDDRGWAPEIKQLFRDVTRTKPVQDKHKMIQLPDRVPGSLLRDPYALPPSDAGKVIVKQRAGR